MAYNRMNGTTPDFRVYAERSGAYTNATVFDRPTVLTREIARIEGMFRSFDLDRTYVMRIGVPVRQYAPESQGYILGFGESSQIVLSDPVTYKRYALAFRNAEDVSLIKVGDAMAARNFAQRFGLNTQGDTAGTVALEIAYRLVDAPPRLGAGEDFLRADILAARVLTQNGQPMFDFGSTRAMAEAPARGEAGAPNALPVLKAADTQGFRIGMPLTEADGLGTRGWKTKLDGAGDSRESFYFNGLTNPKVTWARCGAYEFGFPNSVALSTGDARLPDFADCVAVHINRVKEGQDTIDGISTQQFLPEADPSALLAALRSKYGPPTYVLNQGTNLVWVGRNPATPDAPPVKVTVDVEKTEGRGGKRNQLTVLIVPYADPTPKLPLPAPTAAGPKL